MDLTTFVRTLEPHVFRILLDACVDRLNLNAREVPVLTHAERELASVSRVKAINCLRGRTGLGLIESKDVIDREVPQQQQQSKGDTDGVRDRTDGHTSNLRSWEGNQNQSPR